MKVPVIIQLFPVLTFCFLMFTGSLSAKGNEGFQKLRKPKYGVYVIAHRGVHQGIPENSLPAYQKAIDLGCDFVEIDVRTTKDGKFVSIHNSTIDSYVTGKTGSVKSMTEKELKALDIGLKTSVEWKGTQIPTFEEILRLCKGKTGIYLDLKDAAIPELMAIISKYNLEHDILWYIPYQHFKQIGDPDLIFGNSFPMPDPQSETNLVPLLKMLKSPVIATDMDVLTQSFVNTVHQFGGKVFVDEKEGTQAEWAKIIGWGTDGIQTDKPGELIEFLKQNKKIQ